LEARELLGAAAAQFDMSGEEYCDLMRRESYWGGGPEIVALCNHLKRPIHIYELIPSDEAVSTTSSPNNKHAKTSKEFVLRRMACFGSPKFDRREPLHVLSADSRFPDVEARRARRVGNHFLALFPADSEIELNEAKKREGEGDGKFRRHALIRGGSRGADGGDGAEAGRKRRRASQEEAVDQDSDAVEENTASEKIGRWDGGRGSWSNGGRKHPNL
jgi:hypothetical protein